MDEQLVLRFEMWDGFSRGPKGLTIFSDAFVTGRKAHVCENCKGQIARGERHRTMRSMYEGEFKQHRWCGKCCVAMQSDLEDGGMAFMDRYKETP